MFSHVLAAAVVVGACLMGLSGTAQAEGICPPNFGLSIDDAARIHRAPNAQSPVDGVFYNSHSYHADQRIGGTSAQPEWVHLIDITTGVSGYVHGSVASCAGLTHPMWREHT